MQLRVYEQRGTEQAGLTREHVQNIVIVTISQPFGRNYDTLRDMRVLLTGHRGQLGSALVPRLEAIAALRAVDQRELDIVDRDAVQAAVLEFQPDVIVNAAAYTAVDKAETDTAMATAVNADGPANLAHAAALVGAAIVHFSTDFVFDGRLGAPYRPTDQANPVNVYGKSKLAGEQAIIASNVRGLIIRTSWLFGPGEGNFLATMLRLAVSNAPLRVVADQTGCPTSALVLARWSATIVEALAAGGAPHPAEVVHLACDGPTTWHGFAIEIFRRAGLDQTVEAITTEQFAAAAARPADSRLACAESLRRFGLQPVDWRDGLDEVLRARNSSASQSVESKAAWK